MPAFEVNGGGYVGLQRLLERNIIQGSKLYSASNNLAQAGWCTVSYNSLCSETSTICLPAIFFLLFLLLWKRLATRLSLVSSQKGVFFFRKVTLFSTWKDASSYRKERRLRWRYKKCSGLFWKHGILHRIIMQNRCWQLKKRCQVWK